MPARRRLLTTVLRGGLVAAVALSVAGCEKATPFATVYSDGEAVHSEAIYYCFDGGKCGEFEHKTEVVTTDPGKQVYVEVGKEALRHGWIAQLATSDGQVSSSPPQKDSTFTFQMPQLQGQEIVLRVVALGPSGQEQDRVGEWAFQLRNPTAEN